MPAIAEADVDPFINAVPFISADTADVYLLPAGQDTSHMDALVRRGTLTAYRYVDASPNAAILAIRPRP